MRQFSALYFLLFFVACTAMAQKQERPTDMIFSYVEHPTMINYLIPLIKSSYQKLGIHTHFIPQPSNRNLRLVENNKIDGDVGYMRIVLGGYNNLITVEPPIVLGIFTLLCQPQIPCNIEVLADETVTLVSTSATQKGLEKGYKGKLKAQFYPVNNISIIPEFISLKRFKYAIYPTSEKDLWRLNTADYQFVKLFDSALYHVLNKKYQFMADDVGKALQKTIDEMQVK
ncbi:hypothetical protein [Paraglaciecola sp. L3A3]|uniref:hypothetical protein n=1 Tax=Paraglaciecola sp. L3A3 TaxID=2686358 RepID=UPI00131D1CC4|nr:hypothetical protein [Paraglaciecola sp. L3A3]